jgi:general secretion pathway protein D
MTKRSQNRIGALLGAASLISLALGCTSQPTADSAPPPAPTPVQAPARISATNPPTPPRNELLEPRVEIVAGTGILPGTATPRRQTSISGEGDITLNFVAADIRDVAKTVLGDYLKLNYEIAPTVQGSITIQTSRPLRRAQVLPLLEQALRLNGMVLVNTGGLYKVMPAADAQGTGGPLAARDARGAGYGIEIAPVHYISATEMQKLLGPLVPSQAIIHVDVARNALLIEGTQPEREAIIENIALFDVDWLSGMSYGLYTPNYIDAAELARELTDILGGERSPIGSVVKLVAISRLNTVLAISPQPRYLEQLRAWVRRLDRPGEGSDRRVFVYQVQNGRAADLATTLSRLMGGAGTTNASTPSPTPGADSRNNRQGTANTPATATIQADTGRNGGVSITADETNNSLVVLASPQDYSAIEASLRKLDAPPLQVFLEASIVEVTLTDNLRFGVQYYYSPGGQHQMTLSNTTAGTVASTFPGFSYMFTRGTNIQVVLNTLASLTRVEVTSSPQVLVLNNQTATLQVGDRVPIATEQAVGVTTSSSAIVNSIQYQDTGVILKVTPRVNHGGLVMMDIAQEVSDVANTTSSNIDSPTIQQRKISSSVAVQDGQTVALGGLIRDSHTDGRSGIPYLSRIPVLGALFGDTSNNRTRTELIVLITPHVVENMDQARMITDELRRKLPEVQALLGRTH